MSNKGDLADAMMRQLIDSGALDAAFNYEPSRGRSCCICGATDRPLASGLITGSVTSGGTHMSLGWDVCNQCAPPCDNCKLPVVTVAVRQFMAKLQARDGQQSGSIFLSTHCRHNEQTGSPSSPDSSGPCFVATAVYGDYHHPAVCVLRGFRDRSLTRNMFGRALVKTYYAIGPALARWVVKSERTRLLCRRLLDRIAHDIAKHT